MLLPLTRYNALVGREKKSSPLRLPGRREKKKNGEWLSKDSDLGQRNTTQRFSPKKKSTCPGIAQAADVGADFIVPSPQTDGHERVRFRVLFGPMSFWRLVGGSC